MDLATNLAAMLERTRANIAAGRQPGKVTFTIEVSATHLTATEIWPHGGPGEEGWDANSVAAELTAQYGDHIPLRKLADEWGIGEDGGQLVIQDDAGNTVRMGLRS